MIGRWIAIVLFATLALLQVGCASSSLEQEPLVTARLGATELRVSISNPTSNWIAVLVPSDVQGKWYRSEKSSEWIFYNAFALWPEGLFGHHELYQARHVAPGETVHYAVPVSVPIQERWWYREPPVSGGGAPLSRIVVVCGYWFVNKPHGSRDDGVQVQGNQLASSMDVILLPTQDRMTALRIFWREEVRQHEPLMVETQRLMTSEATIDSNGN